MSDDTKSAPMTAHGEALADWQAIRYGDDDATRAALAYYRERGWKVDNPDFTRDTDEIETRVFSFKSGYEVALKQAEAALAALRADRDEWKHEALRMAADETARRAALHDARADRESAIKELAAERGRREADARALRRYGRHETYCVSRIPKRPPETPCNCGFDAALAAQAGEGNA